MKNYIFKIIALSAVLALTGCIDLFYEDYESSPESSIVYQETAADNELITESETEPETSAEIPEETVITSEITTESTESESGEIFDDYDDDIQVEYHFRTQKQLEQHFEKHGSEFESDFDYETPEDYEAGASDVINNPDALYKTEAEDGDGVYYIEDTNEFVILSTDGYIRTYFRPSAGIKYFNRQ